MKIKVWGARGSLPAPLSPKALEVRVQDALESFFDAGLSTRAQVPDFVRGLPWHRSGGYGGNTPCIEVTQGEQRLIVDGGSGIRLLGYDLMNGACGQGSGEVHLLFTHFHWDHLMGLPFFAPLFVSGNRVHVYAVQPELPNVFKALFSKPFFPVPWEKLGAHVEFHILTPRETHKLGQIEVTPYQLDHPDPCWGFKFTSEGRSFSHCVDTECTRVTREEMGADLPLYQGVDLMFFDAQYTLMETLEKVNWGHSSAGIGLDIAMREGIRRIAFMHHDPASADDKIATVEAQTRRYYEGQLKRLRAAGKNASEVEWLFAREGMEFVV